MLTDNEYIFELMREIRSLEDERIQLLAERDYLIEENKKLTEQLGNIPA